MKHLLIQWAAVWLVLVSAAGCGDRSVGSSEKPTSSPATPAAPAAAALAANDAAAAPAAAAKVSAAAPAAAAAPADAAKVTVAAAKVTAAAPAPAAAAAKVITAAPAPAAAAAKVSTAAPAPAAAAAKVSTAAPAAAAPADIDAAQALFKRNSCNKCHSVDKTKTGPSLQKIAAKYSGKADGQEKIIKNITMAPKIKFEDGTEEEHKVIDTKDQKELKNLSDWILSQ